MPKEPHAAHEAALDARYGRTPSRRRRDRVIIVVVAVLFAAVFGLWVFWAAFDNDQGSINAQDVGHRIVDDSHVTITWRVSVPAGTPVSCALQAQNEAHAIVGWKIVSLPPSPTRTRQYAETIRTSQHAVTGLIYRCWLT